LNGGDNAKKDKAPAQTTSSAAAKPSVGETVISNDLIEAFEFKVKRELQLHNMPKY
jgi:hypothetical protein